MAPFSVRVEDAASFAKVWNYKGIVMPLDAVYHQFATDYANVVLKNFVTMIQQQAELKRKEAEALQAPKIEVVSA